MPKAPFYSACHRATDGRSARRINGARYLFGFNLAILLIVLTTNSSLAATVKGLVGYWPFHEGVGTITKDYSGNENGGLLVNGPAWYEGKFGYSLSFNGVDQHVEIPHAESLNATKELTVSAWIYNRMLSDGRLPEPEFHIIASKGWAPDAGGSWTLAWDKKSNDLSFCARKASDKGYECVFGDYPIAENDWHHVTGVVSSGKLSLYVDGLPAAKPVALGATSINSNREDVRIGAVSQEANKFLQGWDGLIDEVQIFSRALSESEIKAMFQDVASPQSSEPSTTDSGATPVTSASSTSSQSKWNVATPVISPNGGTFASSVSVTLKTDTPGANIYYTTNGTAPTQSSNLYKAPFTVAATSLVKAKAFKASFNPSSEASAWFTIDNQQFDFSLSNSGNKSAQKGAAAQNQIGAALLSGTTQPVAFSISGLPSGANASFSTASCGPACSSTLTVATSAATPAGTFPLVVTGTGGGKSKTTSFNLTVTEVPFDFALSNAGNQSVTAGSPASNKIDTTLVSGSTQAVTFSASGLPAGASASFLSASCSPTCSSTLTINTAAGTTPAGTSTITVSAVGGGVTKTTSFGLTVALPTVATPTINPIGGSFTGSTSVTLATATAGASIRYTTDGSTPTASSTLYSGAFTLSNSATVKAAAFMTNYNPSGVASAAFTINQPVVATPSISPNGGSYPGSVSVTLQTSTAGASIYYTMDGSTPTQASTLYSGAMMLTNSATVKAAAFMANYNPSGVASAAFTITQPFDFSLSNAGNQSVTSGAPASNKIDATLVSGSAQAVTFSAAGLPAGATASFSSASCTPTCSSTLTINTTAGTTPAGTSSITVSASGGGVTRMTTFNLTVSLPTVATPTINPNGGSFSGSVSVTMATPTAGASIRYTTDGSNPTTSSTLYSGAMTLASSATVKAAAFMTNYNPSGVASAAFTISQPFDFSMSASNNGSSTVTAGSSIGFLATATLLSGNSQPVTFSALGLPAGATASFSAASCSPTCSSTLTINTTAGTTPAGTSTITVSAVGGGVTRTTTFNLTVALPTVATPTINPNGGSFTGSTSVTLATATAGALIRYTTDGSTPTSSSTLYSGAFTLSNSATVKAAAFMTNYNPSAVASAAFTIVTSCSAGQFLAEYFNNTTLSGSPTFTNCTPSINYNWGSGGPGNGIGNDLFSVRWTGSFSFNAGAYVFTATADDGIRVWVDGSQIINQWMDQAATTYQATVTLTAGTHVIKVEYYENASLAVAQVGWQASVAPPPPSQLTLMWQDMSTNETGFAIERKLGIAGTYGQIASVGANITSYQDITLVSGSQYCYRVKAFNSTQSSAYSNEDCQIAP